MREIKNLMEVKENEIVIIRKEGHGIKGEWFQDHILDAMNNVKSGKAKAFAKDRNEQ